MIHVSRDKNGFRVTKISNNGEILSQTESLNSKQAAWKNIKAELNSCYNACTSYDIIAVCQDNTLKKPVVYLVGKKRVLANGIEAQTPHIPE